MSAQSEHSRPACPVGVVLIAVVLGGLLTAANSSPTDEPLSPDRRRDMFRSGVTVPAETRRAIDRALKFLEERQNPNGSWTDRVGRKVHYSYEGVVTDHVGVTALVGMAFLANGSLPNRGPYAKSIRGALEYVLEHTQMTGFISSRNSRMYSHAFAALFLAEVYGMTGDSKVREKLKIAMQLIVKAQNKEGGWRYLPGAQDSDMSITVCQVMALRAARNAGVQVPKVSIDRAIAYIKKSFRPREGAFTYQIEDNFRTGPSRASFALTACGVAALYGAGEYDAYEVDRGLEYLYLKRPTGGASAAAGRFDYFYGQYYAVQAAFQRGGAFWERWYRHLQHDFLPYQRPDGSWKDLVGKNYATAMAAIILQMPYQYLPITER